MSSLSNILLDKEILLESGTNELEMLVFDVADYTFGINVAKVREVLPTTEITNLPRAHPSISTQQTGKPAGRPRNPSPRLR